MQFGFWSVVPPLLTIVLALVTSTVLPRTLSAMALLSVHTCVRPSRSSMLTFLTCWSVTSPFASWLSVGRVLSATPGMLHFSRISFLTDIGAEGMQKMISSTPYFLTASAIISRPPTTLTPLMRVPCLPGSSSIRHTAVLREAGLSSNSRIAMAPAVPAPMTRVRFLATGCSCRCLP